jgi:3-dehydroquinate synthase
MQNYTLNLTKTDRPEIIFIETVAQLLQEIQTTIGTRKYMPVTGKIIESHWSEFFSDTFFENLKIVSGSGESRKSWNGVHEILDEAFEQHLDRKSFFVSFGGGIVGDLTGFAASMYLRGAPFIQVPTTVLAMVDASIGGKTGINASQGKNLLGAFHQPKKIYVCREFLTTLSDQEIKNGLAEVIKHAIITDEVLFTDLEKMASPEPSKNIETLWNIIPRAAKIKIDIVERDTLEAGERMKLNLGHTFGHAIEKLAKFGIPHGEAVAIGTVMATEYAFEQGLCDDETLNRIKKIFTAFGIDTTPPFAVKDIWSNMRHDKKRDGAMLHLILPRSIGRVDIVPTAMEALPY